MSDHLSTSMASVAAGDADALATLYDLTSPLVYSLARRILRRSDDAEEVVLDVYVQAWRTAGRFDSSRGTVEAWLLMMARARAVDRLRARAARPDLQPARPVAPDDRPDQDTAARAASACDARTRLQWVLPRLPPSDRRLVELAFFEGCTHRELAAAFGLPLGTVKTRLRNSLQSMRRALSSEGRHPPRVAARRSECCAGGV